MKIAQFINTALEDFKNTFRRFYMPLSLAYLAGLSFMIGVENYSAEANFEVGLMLILGFLLTFAVDTFCEVNKKDLKFRMFGYLVAIVLMALFFVYELDLDTAVGGFRIMFIFGVTFLLATIAPFI